MNEITTHSDNRTLTKQDVIAQKRLIQEVMQAVMREGTHYGVILGCKQPSLYKPGSEAILSTFRIAVDPVVEDLSRSDCYRYRVTCRGVLPSGEIVGSGVGECSTDEEKYHWRGAVNNKEYQATPEDRRRIKYIKPQTWNKDGEVLQVRTNPADLANTALKIAKKRAQIDLTLTATGASDCFSQDLEDLPEEVRDELTREENHQKSGKPAVSQPQSKWKAAAALTEAQLKYHPRIEEALTTLFGGDQAAKDKKLVELTTWTKDKGKDTEKIVAGTPDYSAIKTEKTLEILCSRLEKLAGTKADKQADILPEICADCQQPFINGACRNMTCPEGRYENE